MTVRAAEAGDVDRLAKIWYDGWHDAHAEVVPAELTRVRTLERFRDRLEAALPNVRVVDVHGEPAGFSIVKGNELYQLFVSSHARGSGVAAALLADAEAGIGRDGAEIAWLACAIGNERAARFYEKHGWYRAGTVVNRLTIPNGEFLLDVWRYEKRLT
jgi:GNAT superfamily N-acetyltransferase